jgi:3-oxoacyl-[acyl-carrier protein] reductase
MELKNKIALITGASRGIGASIAKLFAKNGAIVIINYIKNSKAAKEVVEEITKNNGKAISIKADVSNQKEIASMFKKIKTKYSRLDILVNNAGIVINKPFQERTLNDWNKTFSTNLTSAFLCSKKAVKLMQGEKNCSIINVSSMRGVTECGRAQNIDYSASKAAMFNFTKTLAKELAPKIRVNAVAPGQTNTDIAKGYSKNQLKKFIKTIHLGRLIEPEEVAQTILFLASKKASAITGDIIMVDGGQSLN